MEDNIKAVLKDCGALLEGHFLLSSGRHSGKYFQCARLLQFPEKSAKVLSPMAARILEDIKNSKLKVDAVAGPAIGGIIVSYEMARLLGVRALFTERDDTGNMTLRRGFEIKNGENILIVEDVVTTGKSSLETAAVLKNHGAVVSALCCIVDRRQNESPVFDFPFYSACKMDAENIPPSECPLCKNGIPLVKPGSRKFTGSHRGSYQ